VVLTVALATLAAVYVSLQQTKVYRSSADVCLSCQSPASAVVGAPAGSDPVRTATTQAILARSPDVANRALRIAGLSRRRAGDLLAHSAVSAAANADILTFSVKDSDRRIAERLAEDYAVAYTRYRRQLDTAGLTRLRRALDKQLNELRVAGLQNTTAFTGLADKIQELSTLEAVGSSAVIVRPAGGAVQLQPRPVRNGAVAAVLGLLLGLGLVFLREALNTRVRTAAEVHEQLDLPQLARVPEPPRRFRGPHQLIMLAEPSSVPAEAYRILATNLDFVNLERGARTIMFTSATHGEGKSTTVANLAVAYARGGRRIVLVDLDLRKPALNDLFDLGESHGVTSVALRRVELNDALVPIGLADSEGIDQASSRTGQGSLEVLPVGPVPPNPAEFAGSHSLAETLAELEKRADLVLVDAPPMLDLSDAMALTSRVDGLVVVTKLPTAKRADLQELHRVLAAAPTSKLGFVVTGETSEREFHGAYGYGRQTQGQSRPFSEAAH
jgi:tyrosine-protein kinase